MTIGSSITTLLLAPLLLLSVPAAVYFRKMPPPRISPVEQELITFSCQNVALSPRKPRTFFSGLECLVQPAPTVTRPAPAKSDGVQFPPGPLPPGNAPAVRPADQPRRLPRLSMIYNDGATKMAILDGHVLSQGGSLAAGKVLKIEKERILLKTAEREIWLNID